MGIRTTFLPFGITHGKPKWDGKTAFRLHYDSATTFTAQISPTLLSSSSAATIDWGDGTTDEWASGTTPSHSYASGGNYTVIISDDYDSMKNFCRGNEGVVTSLSFGERLKGADAFYDSCTNMVGQAANPGSGMEHMDYCFQNCKSLSRCFESFKNVKVANAIYNACDSLSGQIPDWGAAEKVGSAFLNCAKLDSVLPAWGERITWVWEAFKGCSSLAGCSPELLADPMPSRITTHATCFTDASAAVRQYFTADWGGTKA